ncbi:MAG TPA: porin [Verrucomicrobiae bacterium]|jgi:phosphate-selective porin OprO/OprP|nr:porin [Verrucomicrobiae bacterium]
MKKPRFKQFNRLAVVTAITGLQLGAAALHGATLSDEDVQALVKRVNELEQQVKILQRNREVDQDVATDKAKESAMVSLGTTGLVVKSGDSNFTMIAHGYVQADARNYIGSKATPDEFLLRRVRPIVEGTIWDKFNYRLMLDLASGSVTGSTANNVGILDDAYLNARIFDDLQVQAGKFKSPVGLERLQSTADLFFVETGFATELTPNYDLGVEVHNDLFTSPIAYAVGVFNGASDNASDDAETDEGKDVAGRLFLQPFLKKNIAPLRNLGFGVAGSYGEHNGGSLTSYKTPGQQTMFTYANAAPGGDLYRIDPQLFWYWGPFGLEGEYNLSSQKLISTKTGAGIPPYQRFNNTAWQVEASYFLTDEENSFKASSLKHVTPWHRFAPTQGEWGAFEVVARVQQLSLDENAFTSHAGTSYAAAGSAQRATAWGVGLNWYLNENLKLNLDYESTTFHGGTALAGSATSRPEHVILSRIQFQF